MFNPASSDEAKQAARDMVGKKFDYLESKLDGQDYLTGEHDERRRPLSVRDARLDRQASASTCAAGRSLTAFRKRMAQREAVQTVLRRRGWLEPRRRR